jgi:hypothetical protein
MPLAFTVIDRLLETLDVLSRKEEREGITRAKRQVRMGKTTPMAEIKKKHRFE